jgi:hypothetical protein
MQRIVYKLQKIHFFVIGKGAFLWGGLGKEAHRGESAQKRLGSSASKPFHMIHFTPMLYPELLFRFVGFPLASHSALPYFF